MVRARYLSAVFALIIVILLFALNSPLAHSGDTRPLVGGFPKRDLDDTSLKLIQENFRMFTDYVGKRIGRKITLEPVEDLKELREKLKSKELDFTWAWTPIESIKVWSEYPLTPFISVDPINDGKSRVGFRYFLLTRADNSCTKLDDLKGKTLLYLASQDGLFKDFSLIFVEILLNRQGKKLKDFFKVTSILGKDEEANSLSMEYGPSKDLILRVISNPDVVASIKEEAYLLLTKRNPKIKNVVRVIAATDPFPPLPYFVWRDEDPELMRKLKTILLNMNRNPEGEEILRSIRLGKLVDVGEREYGSLKRLVEEAKELGIQLSL